MGKYSDLLLGAPASPPEAEPGKYSRMLLGAPEPAAAPAQREVPFGEAAAQGFIDFATMGYGDEAEAGLRAGYGKLDTALGGVLPGEPETYDQAIADVRGRQENAGLLPYAAGAIPGAVLGPGVAGAKFVAKGATTAAKYGRAALGGGIEGMIAGFGNADGAPQERVPGAVAGGAMGIPFGLLGQGLTQGVTALASRRAARDLGKLNPEATAELMAKAQAAGVQLTPAEATNLPSLKAQQKMLGNLTDTADTMGDFYRKRADTQIAPAVERTLRGISEVDSPEAAAELTRAAGKTAMNDVAANRAAQASPLYKRAFETAKPVNVTQVIGTIDQKLKTAKGPIAASLQKARELLFDGDAPDARLIGLHQAKLALDDMIEGARESGLGRTAKRELVDVKNQLVQAMDRASPDYQAARAIFSDLSPGVDRVREGVAGVIAELPDSQLRLAAGKLFSPGNIGPNDAGRAMAQIEKANPDAANAIRRAWLEDKWLQAGKETLESGGAPVNQGAKWRQALMGDPKQRRILEATLKPEQFKAVADLSEVLAAAGRVKPLGSDTAWNQELMRAERESARPWVSRALGMLSRKEVESWFTERALSKRAGQLAEIVTSPEGMARLKELKQLGVNPRLAIGILGQGFAAAGLEGAIQ